MELRKEIQKILNNNTINDNRVDRLEKLTKEYSSNQQYEMLEMLKNISNALLMAQNPSDKMLIEEIDQLIQKATTI